MIELLLMVLAVAAFARRKWLLFHYQKYEGRRGVTGCEIARQLLDLMGFSQMTVLSGEGWERYNGIPMRQIFLAPSAYQGQNLQAIAETARQTVLMAKASDSFLPLEWVLRIQKILRFLILPGWILLIVGLISPASGLLKPGFWILELAALLAILERPREWEVSRAAYELLSRCGCFEPDELVKLRHLLEAARFEGMTEIFRVPGEVLSAAIGKKREKHGV